MLGPTYHATQGADKPAEHDMVKNVFLPSSASNAEENWLSQKLDTTGLG